MKARLTDLIIIICPNCEGGNEITAWCCEIDPSDCFYDFIRVWNMAQRSNNTGTV